MKEYPVTVLKGIGPKTAEALEKIGIRTTLDLIRHYPARFVRYPEIRDISTVREGETAAVKAETENTLSVIRHGSLVITQGKLCDDSGDISAVWYHMPYLKNSVHPGFRYAFFGKAVRKRGRFYLEQPFLYKVADYEKIAGRLMPVYPLTAGISNRVLSSAIEKAFSVTELPEDYLPGHIREKYSLCDENKALFGIHHPGSDDDFSDARKRIVFDEFFGFLLKVRSLREKNERILSPFSVKTGFSDELLSVFPFTLTDGQKKAYQDIEKDFNSGHVMNRLIQGDVGSGKTAVAVLALYTVFRNGFQGAVMVPTEVLAKQHMKTITEFFMPLKKKPSVVLLTGSMTEAEKRKAREEINEGKADIVIGTHALIQEKVSFKNLTLVVTDEQHRFGVRQREAFAGKGNHPHILVMSATPIPRTLAVILYGDLDVSTIDQKPVGRLPVKNCIIGTEEREKAYLHIRREIRNGHQAYIICPLVEESEFSDAEDVTDYSERMEKCFSGTAKVTMLHGKMPDKTKNRIMTDFLERKTDILVSTTVVEVGVDVPNATVIMIENADRFGLAALHQLRGRVGRGKDQSYCIFVNTSHSSDAAERLKIVSGTNDGFKIASEDLKMRGPGELFGSEQSGELTFGIGDIYNDNSILKDAYEAVKSLDEVSFRNLSQPVDELF